MFKRINDFMNEEKKMLDTLAFVCFINGGLAWVIQWIGIDTSLIFKCINNAMLCYAVALGLFMQWKIKDVDVELLPMEDDHGGLYSVSNNDREWWSSDILPIDSKQHVA